MDNNDYYQPAGGASASGPVDDATAAVPADDQAETAATSAPVTDAWENPIAQAANAVPVGNTTATDDANIATTAQASDITPPEAARAEEDPAKAYDAFIDALIEDLGFNDLQDPQKTELVNAIRQRVETRVLRTLLTSLTQEQTDEINKEIDAKGLTEEAIIELLSQKAPNASATILSALDDLYQEMKEETDVIWKAAAGQAGADADATTDQAA